MNPNPCLAQPEIGLDGFLRPTLFTTVYRINETSPVNQKPSVTYNDGYKWDVTGYAGSIGYRMSGLEIESGMCYILKVVADSSLRFNSTSEANTNFSIAVTVYRDDGTISILPSQMFQSYSGHNEWVWGVFSLANNPVLSIEVVYNAVWATANFGSWITFTEIGLYQSTNTTYCARVAGV